MTVRTVPDDCPEDLIPTRKSLMRFDFHNSWLRLVIELFPPAIPVRRYRPAGERIAPRVRRRMARHIRRQLRAEFDAR
jgi:hypothetical protein